MAECLRSFWGGFVVGGGLILSINLYKSLATSMRDGCYVYHGWLGPTMVIYNAPLRWSFVVGVPVLSQMFDNAD